MSAYAASSAASLVSMVSRLTLKKPEYERHWPKVKEIFEESDSLQKRLLALVDEDSQSFASLMQAYRLPKESVQEKRVRSEEIQTRLKGAADVPLKTAEKAASTLSLARNLAEFANESALSDLQTAVFLAYAGAQGAVSNVTINLPGIKDEDYKKQVRMKLDAVQKQIDKDRSDALSVMAKRSKTT